MLANKIATETQLSYREALLFVSRCIELNPSISDEDIYKLCIEMYARGGCINDLPMGNQSTSKE